MFCLCDSMHVYGLAVEMEMVGQVLFVFFCHFIHGFALNISINDAAASKNKWPDCTIISSEPLDSVQIVLDSNSSIKGKLPVND